LPRGQANLTSFFNHINILSPHIQFTMETQKDNSIPLLDVLISCLPNGSISHQVYRKKTYIERYLNVSSHHHPTQNFIFLKTMITRAICIFTPQFLAEEKTHLTKALLSNCDPGGYRWPPTFSNWLKIVFWEFWKFTIFSRF
jgi:hypothetical protein